MFSRQFSNINHFSTWQFLYLVIYSGTFFQRTSIFSSKVQNTFDQYLLPVILDIGNNDDRVVFLMCTL